MLLLSSGTKDIVGIDRAGDSHNITVGAALRNWNSTWYLCSVLGKSEFISGSCEIRVHQISNGNRTEWSPIWSVIIRVINKIGRPRSVSPICLITSMITDRIFKRTNFCHG